MTLCLLLCRHLEEFGISEDRITFDCSSKDEFSRQACMTRGNSTLVILRMIFKGIRYPVSEGVLIIVSFVAFIYYGPAIICLFSPTVTLVNGQRHHFLTERSKSSQFSKSSWKFCLFQGRYVFYEVRNKIAYFATCCVPTSVSTTCCFLQLVTATIARETI